MAASCCRPTKTESHGEALITTCKGFAEEGSDLDFVENNVLDLHNDSMRSPFA